MQNGYVCGLIRSPASEHQNECNYSYLDRRCDHWFCCVCRRTCRELSVPSQETIENRCKACFGIDVNMKPVRFWYRIAFLPACRPSIDCARRVRPGYYEGAGPKPAAFVLCCSCALLVHRPAATDRRRSVNVGVEFGGSAHCPRRRCAEPSHCSWSSVATAGINYGNNGTFLERAPLQHFRIISRLSLCLDGFSMIQKSPPVSPGCVGCDVPAESAPAHVRVARSHEPFAGSADTPS